MRVKLSSVFYATLILITLHRKKFIVDSKHVGLQSNCNVQAISCSCKDNYGLEEYVTVELCVNHTKSPCQVKAVLDQCRKKGKLIEFTSSFNFILHLSLENVKTWLPFSVYWLTFLLVDSVASTN